jgi:hypothetical protein
VQLVRNACVQPGSVTISVFGVCFDRYPVRMCALSRFIDTFLFQCFVFFRFCFSKPPSALCFCGYSSNSTIEHILGLFESALLFLFLRSGEWEDVVVRTRMAKQRRSNSVLPNKMTVAKEWMTWDILGKTITLFLPNTRK